MLVQPPVTRVADGTGHLAAALRAPQTSVRAIDSNPRAIEATLWAAASNGVAGRVTAALDCDGSSISPGTFEFVLANPPYYSNFRIAELFLRVAHRALARGGKALIVTKSSEWYLENVPVLLGEAAGMQVTPFSCYVVVQLARG